MMRRTAMNIGAALGPLIAAALILVDRDLPPWSEAATAPTGTLPAFALLPAARAARGEEVEDTSGPSSRPPGSARSAPWR